LNSFKSQGKGEVHREGMTQVGGWRLGRGGRKSFQGRKGVKTKKRGKEGATREGRGKKEKKETPAQKGGGEMRMQVCSSFCRERHHEHGISQLVRGLEKVKRRQGFLGFSKKQDSCLIVEDSCTFVGVRKREK